MNRVSFIFGTRPEAIKLCPLIRVMRADPKFEVHVCVTAQHRTMLDQALELFDVRPDIDLDLMRPNQSLPSLTSSSVTAIDSYLGERQPDLVLVQGDTTTTFCASLAAFYRQIPVGHVEAGLRTSNKFAPFPEEINRALTSRLADYHFAPTNSAKANLLREGVAESQIFVTGNTVVDALRIALGKVRERHVQIPGLPPELLNGRRSTSLVLITGHRRENFGAGFKSICEAVKQLASEFPKTAFVYPVHLNPNVQVPVFELLSGIDNVFLLEPLSYSSFVVLLDRATFILTDSGGIQEEAPSVGKRVLVMRDTTERPEAVEAGMARLVGTETDQIVAESRKLLLEGVHLADTRTNPFGDGKASNRILQIITDKLANNSGVA